MPYVLGTRPRFVLEGIGHGWRRHVTYQVRSDVRGRFEIGPMTVRVTDPFGMVELGRAFHTTAPLTVTPRTVAAAEHPDRRRLDRVRRQPAAGVRHRQRRGRHRPRVPPRRRAAPRALAQLGPGRRADGASRGAALAVAGHPVPRQPDQRRTAARASPPPSRRPSRSRPRWRVHLSRRGFTVRLVTAHGRGPRRGLALPGGRAQHRPPARGAGRAPAHAHRRSSTPAGSPRPATAAWWSRSSARVEDADAAVLRRMQHHAGAALAVALDVAAWTPAAARHRTPASRCSARQGWRAVDAAARRPARRWSGRTWAAWSAAARSQPRHRREPVR